MPVAIPTAAPPGRSAIGNAAPVHQYWSHGNVVGVKGDVLHARNFGRGLRGPEGKDNEIVQMRAEG